MGFAPTFYFGKNRIVRTESLTSRIRQLAEESLPGGEFELVHVELSGSGNRMIVRVFIDKPGGVNHDDCALVSQAIERRMDMEDPIENEYVLEVSSPGIERGLYRLEDFERFAGNEARIETFEAIEGQRNFKGVIDSISGNTVLIEDRSSGKSEIDFDQIKKANLIIDVERELRKGSKNSRKRAR